MYMCAIMFLINKNGISHKSEKKKKHLSKLRSLSIHPVKHVFP